MSTSTPQWDVIAITAPQRSLCDAHVDVLARLQRSGKLSPQTLLLSIPDSLSHAAVGSGGATLNALLVTTEHLSARAQDSSINPCNLQLKAILVINVGASARRVPFRSTLPLHDCDGAAVSQIEFLLALLSREHAGKARAGAWVCSADAIMADVVPAFGRTRGPVSVLSTPAHASLALQHGYYLVKDGQDTVRRLEYRREWKRDGLGFDADSGREEEEIQLVCGLVYFDTDTCQKLLNLAMFPPFDCCTYLGIDDGGIPVSLSLFLDIIRAMLPETRKNELTIGKEGRVELRDVLWEELHEGLSGREVVLMPTRQMSTSGSASGLEQFRFIHTASEYVQLHTAPRQGFVASAELLGFRWSRRIHCHVEEEAKVSDSAVISNSVVAGPGSIVIGKSALVEHCCLVAPEWSVGDRSLCSGIRAIPLALQVPADYVLQQLEIEDGQFVFVFYQQNDGFASGKPLSFCGRSIEEIFQIPGVTREDLWEGSDGSIEDARLFPIVSFQPDQKQWPCSFRFLWSCIGKNLLLEKQTEAPDVLADAWKKAARLSLSEVSQRLRATREVTWRREASLRVDVQLIRKCLVNREDVNLRPVYERIAQGDYWLVFNELDAIAADPAISSDIAARVLAHIGDALAAFAPPNTGGIRSGPSNNRMFQPAINELEFGKVDEAVRMLADVRAKWIETSALSCSSRAESLIRAARHYEGAAAVLTRRSTLTCAAFVSKSEIEQPPMNTWVHATSPVRIDIAGGWTDTPPITFECGGIVTNVAVMIDGVRPIGCKARRIQQTHVVFRIRGFLEVTCNALGELRDYNKPSAPAALLKAALLCTGIVSLESDVPLSLQLSNKLGGGMEIESYSNLPMGSGMGTSSILAGCILTAIARTAGMVRDKSSLVHEVLIVEQMLTTGGGWQDQAGGIWPGVKRSCCTSSLPLRVDTRELTVSEEFIQRLNKHMILLFTGKARLARNLLQNVVRRWFARLPETVKTIQELKRNAEDAASAFEAEDIEQIGACLRKYWSQKKMMAKGCEPPFVARIFETLRKQGLLYGEALCGAGGGGFMVLITRIADSKERIRTVLEECKEVDSSALEFHDVSIDIDGLKIE